MTQFNLLPWREQKRKEQKIQFALKLCVSSVVGLFFLLIIHVYVDIKIKRQLLRNSYLQSVIDNESTVLFVLNGKRKKMLEMDAKLDYLKSLRRESFQAVKLLDTLPRVMPEAVTLSAIIRNDNKITLLGKSISSMQVTLLMENMQKSAVFLQPVLTEISAKESRIGEERIFQIEAEQKE